MDGRERSCANSSLAAPPLVLQSQAWALGLVVGFISLLVGLWEQIKGDQVPSEPSLSQDRM